MDAENSGKSRVAATVPSGPAPAWLSVAGRRDGRVATMSNPMSARGARRGEANAWSPEASILALRAPEDDLPKSGDTSEVGPGSDLKGADEVLAPVAAGARNGDLRTRDDDGLAERRQQEGQRRRGVGHRVGPVQDDEAGVVRSTLVKHLRDRAPVLGGGIGGVDRRVELEELDRG